MTHYNLALIGFGNVGRAFARLLERKQDELQNSYGITYTITAIATGRHGAAIHPGGIPGAEAAAHVEAGGSRADFSAIPAPTDMFEQIRTCVAYNGANVKLLAGYAGLSDFKDGPTHHSVFDLAYVLPTR